MKHSVIFRDIGTIGYKTAWDLQENLHAEAVAIKLAARNIPGENSLPENHLIFCEHPSVFTIGKSGSEQNLLINPEKLKEKNIELFRTNRGGDITYHGPGQIIGYPIIDLEQFELSVRSYIYLIEESIIQTIAEFGILAGRLPGASGVWIEQETYRARKICAIGVRTSRFMTMHGFALNVNTDLKYFSYINPCGYTDKAVTSMEKENGREVDLILVKSKLKEKIAKLFQMELREG
jgi:lipoyl(octanoyl) transferase